MTPKQYIPRTMKGTARSYADNPGKLWHGVLPGEEAAICGTRPGKTSAGWDSFVGKAVTCHKCLKRLALLPKDPTDDPDCIIKTIGCSLIIHWASHSGEAGQAASYLDVTVEARVIVDAAKERLTWHIADLRDLKDRMEEDMDLVQRLRAEADRAVSTFVDKAVDQVLAGAGEAGHLPFHLVAAGW